MGKNIFKIIAAIMAIVFISGMPAGADNVQIGQIDPSRLLLNQTIKLYISVTNVYGFPVENLKEEMFKVYESGDGKDFKEIKDILTFSPQVNSEQGINFLLVIDNSGSMYYKLSGEATEVYEEMRISQAKQAVISFLNTMLNPKDTVGLAAFNTNFTLLSPPITDREKLITRLDEITKPGAEEIYTEIYASLYEAVDEFLNLAGRKVIVLLTDGQNEPYFTSTKKMHPKYKDKLYEYTEPVLFCQEEGVSVFAINFRAKKVDENLKAITLETGGLLFDASDKRELENVYQAIHNHIVNEYLITYRATMEPAVKKYVKVEFTGNNQKSDATRFYFSSTVLGLPAKGIMIWLFLIPFFIALFLLWALSLLKFEKKKSAPSIQVLTTQVGSPSTRVLPLTTQKTVIGGGRNANLTITNAPDVKENHATIVMDTKTKKYTIVGEGEILVNNKAARNRTLEAGDVINIGGTTIVFDDGEV